MRLYNFFHRELQFVTRKIFCEKEMVQRCIVQSNKQKKIIVLDFGCGEGIFSDIIHTAQYVQYVGVDKDFNSIKFAKKALKYNCCIVANETLCFRNNVFDIVILNNVLHHMTIEKRSLLITEIRRTMNRGALLIVIELVPRREQKGLFFRFITFMEEKFHKISYCDREFLNNFLEAEFKRISCEKLNANFIGCIFSN